MTDEEVVDYLRSIGKDTPYEIVTLNDNMTSNRLPYNEEGDSAPVGHTVKNCFKGSRDSLEEEVEEEDLLEWVSHAKQITVPVSYKIDEGIRCIVLFQKNWDGSWAMTFR